MVEEEIARRYKEQEMRCPVHLSIGQEANAVAIASCLTNDDHMVSTHRGHAHYLAKGGRLDGLIGELYGKAIGCSRGNGGSMHLTDVSCGFLASTSIVGGTIPIGVGSAFSAKVLRKDRLSVVCIGDAAIEEGVFHECANFASVENLGVIFFMENNNYSCFTPRYLRQPKRPKEFESVAECHGMNFIKISWSNFFDDYIRLRNVVSQMRKQNLRTPLLVECDAYRFVEHCGPSDDDELNYRPPLEVEQWKRLDPLEQLKRELFEVGYLNNTSLLELNIELGREIESTFTSVKASPPPDQSELGAYLYA